MHIAVPIHGTIRAHEESHSLDVFWCQKAEFKATGAGGNGGGIPLREGTTEGENVQAELQRAQRKATVSIQSHKSFESKFCQVRAS